QSFWDGASQELKSYIDSVSDFLVNMTSEESRLVTGAAGTVSALGDAVAAGATDAELLAILKDVLQNDYLDLSSEAREMGEIAIGNGDDYAEYWDRKASDYSAIANKTRTVQSFAEFTEHYNKYTQPARKLFGVAGLSFDAAQLISYVREGDDQNATKKLLT